MNKIKILSILLLLCSIINAQNRITGKVTDSDSLPLPGATVYIHELNKGTITDINGDYIINNVPDGKLNIQYSFMGYGNVIQTIVLNKSDKVLNVVLNQTSIEAEEIVVSGGYNSTQHENAVKIDVLKLGELYAVQTPNFTKVLTRVPGVDMISKGSGVSKPVIRGLSMNDILVLNNGFRFENYQYSSHHPLGIDEFGIADVEIIKGPASLIYGSDAIGGVINFIKEKPASVGKIAGDYNLQLFSNTSGMTNNIGLKGTSKNFFGGVRIGQKTNADYLQGGGSYAPNSRFNEYSIKANAGYAGETGAFRIFFDHNTQKLGLVEEEAIEIITNRGRANEIFYQQLNTNMFSLQNKIYLGKYKLDLNSSYQNTELIHFAEAGVYEIQMNLATLTYETKLYLPSDEKSEYILGFQGLNQKNTNLNDRETILLPDALTNNYSAFCLLQRTFFDKLKLQTGIRYDYKTISTDETGLQAIPESYRPSINKNFNSFSGSIGSTSNILDHLFLRVNFATAFRTPNLAELTSNGQHETRYEVGEQDLVPENSYESDLSLHYHRENISVDISGFYNIVNNYIYISPTGETTTSGLGIYKYKQNNSVLYGCEAGIHIHPEFIPWLHFQTTYANVTGRQRTGEYLPFVPADKLNFELRAESKTMSILSDAFISLRSGTAFDKNDVAPEETTTPGYTLFDFGVGGNLKINKQDLIVCLNIDNILDTKYVDHLSTLKEVGLLEPGRNVVISVKVPF